MADDAGRERRQIGLIDMQGRTAAHTGAENGDWAGSRQGLNYTVQANIMVGSQVVDAVAEHFEPTAGLWRPILETFPEPPTFDVDPGLKREDPERFQDLLATYREKADAFEEAYGAYDQEAVEAVDAFRHDHGMEYQGNPRGLVDARLVNALREVHYKRAKP